MDWGDKPMYSQYVLHIDKILLCHRKMYVCRLMIMEIDKIHISYELFGEKNNQLTWRKKDWENFFSSVEPIVAVFRLHTYRESVHPIRGIFNYFMKFFVVSSFSKCQLHCSCTLCARDTTFLHMQCSVCVCTSIEFSFLALIIIIIISSTLLLLSFILFICAVCAFGWLSIDTRTHTYVYCGVWLLSHKQCETNEWKPTIAKCNIVHV